MDNDPPDLASGRDIAGGWLLCAVIAALALGVMSALHSGISPEAAAATTAASCLPEQVAQCPTISRMSSRRGVLAAGQGVCPGILQRGNGSYG